MTEDCPANVDLMKPANLIEGEDALDTKLLREMAVEARDFISSHDWCESIDHQYLAYGIGGVVGVFLVQITPRRKDVDKWLWAIVGDLPPAYIVVDDNPTAFDALDAYCSEMGSWVEAVEGGESTGDLIPVNAPATPEFARQLAGRLEYLRLKVLPLAQKQAKKQKRKGCPRYSRNCEIKKGQSAKMQVGQFTAPMPTQPT